jgi:hypothetical protein
MLNYLLNFTFGLAYISLGDKIRLNLKIFP